MHTIIHPLPLKPAEVQEDSVNVQFRNPHYDCLEQAEATKVVVYVPGVSAQGVEIIVRGPDLIVTARKAHFVRVNWKALHLEGAQQDYQLRLRLGNSFQTDALRAEIADGVLSLTLPKKHFDAVRQRRVA